MTKRLKAAELYTHTHTHTHTCNPLLSNYKNCIRNFCEKVFSRIVADKFPVQGLAVAKRKRMGRLVATKLMAAALVVCFGFSAHATTDIQPNGNLSGGNTAANCTQPVLGTYSGSTNFEAKWRANTVPLRWYNESERITTVQDAAKTCTYDGTLTIPATPPSRTGYTFAGWRLRMPGTYTELEYLSFANYANVDKAYLDTGIILTNNHKIKVRANSTNFLGVMGRWCENVEAGTSFQFYNAYYRFGSNILTNNLSTYFNSDVTLTYSQDGLYVNDTLIGVPQKVTFTAVKTCLIGSVGTNDSDFVGKIYEAWIELGGNMVGHYIPARRNSDNALGMYDTVSGNFLTNVGSGTLTAGPALD